MTTAAHAPAPAATRVHTDTEGNLAVDTPFARATYLERDTFGRFEGWPQIQLGDETDLAAHLHALRGFLDAVDPSGRNRVSAGLVTAAAHDLTDHAAEMLALIVDHAAERDGDGRWCWHTRAGLVAWTGDDVTGLLALVAGGLVDTAVKPTPLGCQVAAFRAQLDAVKAVA